MQVGLEVRLRAQGDCRARGDGPVVRGAPALSAWRNDLPIGGSVESGGGTAKGYRWRAEVVRTRVLCEHGARPGAARHFLLRGTEQSGPRISNVSAPRLLPRAHPHAHLRIISFLLFL